MQAYVPHGTISHGRLAVNPLVVGSIPTQGAKSTTYAGHGEKSSKTLSLCLDSHSLYRTPTPSVYRTACRVGAVLHREGV
jgi:hypothetical protein